MQGVAGGEDSGTSGANRSMSLRQRLGIASLNEWDSEPDWFFCQLMKISDGTSIADIAQSYGVSYGVLRNWIAANPEREKMYAAAVRYRKEFVEAKERP